MIEEIVMFAERQPWRRSIGIFIAKQNIMAHTVWACDPPTFTEMKPSEIELVLDAARKHEKVLRVPQTVIIRVRKFAEAGEPAVVKYCAATGNWRVYGLAGYLSRQEAGKEVSRVRIKDGTRERVSNAKPGSIGEKVTELQDNSEKVS